MKNVDVTPSAHSIEFELYPEHPLANRTRLAYAWIPKGTNKLLDAGCNSGYGTRHFAKKAKETWGIDPDEAAIRVARNRYPEIHFEHSRLEKLLFPDHFFDVVVIADVFEHVRDEIAALNEIHRVTKPGATVIVTTPHTGLFGWFDPYNYGYYLRKHLPRLYVLLMKRKLSTATVDLGPKHRHYSLKSLERLFRESNFGSHYTVGKTFRSGCFLFPLELNVSAVLERLVGKKGAKLLATPFRFLSEVEFWIPWGALAYNVALSIGRADY